MQVQHMTKTAPFHLKSHIYIGRHPMSEPFLQDGFYTNNHWNIFKKPLWNIVITVWSFYKQE